MEEVLLKELVEESPCGHAQASLHLEKVHILWWDVVQIADGKEGVVGVDDVGTEASMVLSSPSIIQRPVR